MQTKIAESKKTKDGFYIIDGKHYMDGRDVAAALGKEFKKLIRDLKTIALMLDEIDNGDLTVEAASNRVHHRDRAKIIDLHNRDGLVVINKIDALTGRESQTAISEIYMDEIWCDYMKCYSNFKLAILLVQKWHTHKELVKQLGDNVIELCAKTEEAIASGDFSKAMDYAAKSGKASAEQASDHAKGLAQRKKEIKIIKRQVREIVEQAQIKLPL